MSASLPIEAQKRSEQELCDLRRKYDNNVQRLRKWAYALENHGPCGESYDGAVSLLTSRSLILGGYGWTGSWDREPTCEEINAELASKLEPLIECYASEALDLLALEWSAVGLSAPEFDAQLARLQQGVEILWKQQIAYARKDLDLQEDLTLAPKIQTHLKLKADELQQTYFRRVLTYGRGEQTTSERPTDKSEPGDQAHSMTGEPEADGPASALAIPEAAITTTGKAAGDGQCSAIENTATLGVKSDATKQEDAKQRRDNARKGDATLLGEKLLVSFKTAEQYLGISERQRQKLISSGALKVEGQGQNRKITAESLKAYLPPEIPN